MAADLLRHGAEVRDMAKWVFRLGLVAFLLGLAAVPQAFDCPPGFVMCRDGLCAPACDDLTGCPEGYVLCGDVCAPMCNNG
jgi:hypothetical protein